MCQIQASYDECKCIWSKYDNYGMVEYVEAKIKAKTNFTTSVS